MPMMVAMEQENQAMRDSRIQRNACATQLYVSVTRRMRDGGEEKLPRCRLFLH